MAIILMDGFESAPTLRSGISLNSTAVAGVGRDGVGRGIGGASASTAVTVGVPVAVAWDQPLFCGWGQYITANHLASGGVVATWVVGGANQVSIRMTTAGLVQGVMPNSLILNGPSVLGVGWHYFESKLIVHQTAGVFILKIDGVTHINFVGDTMASTSLTGTFWSNVAFSLNSSSQNGFLDDLYMLDNTGPAPYNDFIGERVIKGKRPVGNGASSQFLGSDGDSVDNYLLVDDDPVNTTDYVASNVAGDRDLYALGAATGLATVDGVQVVVYASKSDSGARSFKPLLRDSAGNVQVGPTYPLSTSWVSHYTAVQLLAPDGAAWTPVKVNAIQAGIETV